MGNVGEIEFDGALTNAESTGRIIGRNARLRFNNTLYNQGGIAFSFGTSDILGDINNTGAITVTGNSSVTFWDDLINDGTIKVSSGSTIPPMSHAKQ